MEGWNDGAAVGILARQGIALRAKVLFLNLPQVGAIKCNWYRIRPVEGGELSQEKTFELRNGAGWFGILRNTSDWLGDEGRLKRVSCKSLQEATKGCKRLKNLRWRCPGM